MGVYVPERSNLIGDEDVTVVRGPMHTEPEPNETVEPTPRSLGRYVIVAEVGAGGMGRVFRAYDPKLEREVALKLLRRVTRDAHARLRREAQAMAKLCHPNVLPVYDVDTQGHRLFIAMELVRGQSLREWLDAGERPWVEVLEVLVAAGRGLAAAHAAGLVHRDFKPGNVLLGDDGRVRVMDFGLARGTPSDSSDSGPGNRTGDSWSRGLEESSSGIFPRHLHATGSHDLLTSFGDDLTQLGTVVGTPAYMAPEQHLGRTADHRCDQYGFCVALWEALYGLRPFETDDTDSWYRIKATTPPRARPERGVPRWLQAVVKRGLAPRATDRYASMSVLLHALSQGSRHRRHRRWLGVALGSALVLGGVGGLSHVIDGATLCTGAGDELAEIWNESTAAEAERAVLQTAVAYAPATWARVQPQLDDYAARWRAAHMDACEATHVRQEQPEARLDARMRCLDERRRGLRALVHTLSAADATMVERAVSAVDALPAIELCADPDYVLAQAPPPRDPLLAGEVAAIEDELARVTAQVDAGQTKQARDVARMVLARAERLGHGPLEARARFVLGTVEAELGHYEESRIHFEQTYFAAQREGLDALQVRAATQLILVLGTRMGQPEAGEPWERFARAALHRVHDPAVEASYLNNAGLLASERGDYDTAITRLERALTLHEQQLDPSYAEIATVLNNLALMHDAQGRYDEAMTLHERALAIRERVLGPEHPHVASSLLNLASVLEVRALGAEALELQLRALAINERAYGRQHPQTAGVLVNLGTTHQSMGQLDRALERYREALPILVQTQGAHHPHVAGTLANLGNVYRELGQPGQALEHYERSLELMEKAQSPDPFLLAITLANMGALAYDQEDLEPATLRLERALTHVEATVGLQHPLAAMIRGYQALIHSARGEHEDALRLHREALEVRRALLGPQHPDTAASLRQLGGALVDAGQPMAAIEPLEQALEILAQHEDHAAARHEARFELARAWWDLEVEDIVDRKGSLSMAREARSALRELDGDHRRVLRAIDRWIHARAAGRLARVR